MFPQTDEALDMFPQTDEVKKRAVQTSQRMWKQFAYSRRNAQFQRV